MFFVNPEFVLSQSDDNSFRRVPFQRIIRYTPSRRDLHLLDYDAIPLTRTRCPGAEKLESVVKFTPHNFPGVSHLDLADAYFTRTREIGLDIGGNPPEFTPEEHRFLYGRMCMRRVAIGFLHHIHHNPDSISKHLRTLMDYTFLIKCIKDRELINVTKFCLTSLHNQLYPDGKLVAEVLLTFCRLQTQKEAVVNGAGYSHDCIEYLLESCRKIRFDLQYFFRHSRRGRVLGFCPIRSCVLYAETNLLKMNAFLQYGFTPLELNGCARTAIYLGLRLLQQMRSRGINPIHEPYLHRFYIGNRRADFLMELFYMMFGSLGPRPQVWMQCSKLFFDSVVDSFICTDEINVVLNALCRPDDHPIVIEAFETYFKDVIVEKPTPRTLKHQARCHIRKRMTEQFRLPDGVYLLNLPHTLYSYLKLDD